MLCSSESSFFYFNDDGYAEEEALKFWSIQMSRLLLIFFLLAIGIIIGWFLHGYVKQRKGESDHGL